MPVLDSPAVRRTSPALWVLTLSWLLGLIASGWHPYERGTWWMEVAPALIALPILWLTARRFALTPLLYALLTLHGLILMLGGAYTYARVPLGFELQQWFELSRNPYDKIGHFAQGFVPYVLCREILIRQQVVRGAGMRVFLSLCVILAISASYELIEWGAALALGQGAESFLGTQGDPWDTQSDMGFALLGAIAAAVLISGWHDHQLHRLRSANLTPASPRP